MATVVSMVATGCLTRELQPINPCTVSGVVRNVKVNAVEEVDVLFMVDNSNSMMEEQANLAREFNRMVTVLASGDLDDDGMQDFPPVKSLRIGVVNSDMGTGGFVVETCSESNFGDDGVLRTVGNTARPGCMGTYPKFLDFSAGTTNVESFATDVTCVAAMGINGCGFEQQLEAILKALTPSSSSLRFNMSTVGHGDVANSGFLRSDSLLAIISLTDEDDCSARDVDLFNRGSATYAGDLNLRCFSFPDALHGIDRFVNGLLDLRSDPDLLIYAGIVGVPPEIVGGDITDYDRILSDPAMQERIDMAMPTRLVPSCNRPGTGLAFPPVRMVRVGQELEARGANTTIQSICQDNFTGALNAIIKKIADVLGGACLPRALNPDATGRVNCDVVEVLKEGSTCAEFEAQGRVFARTQDGQEVCRINQLVPAGSIPSGQGWYYDNFTADTLTRCSDTPQRISFSPGAEPRAGSTIRLECLQPVGMGGGDEVEAGSPCAGDGDCNAMPGGNPLRCEATSNTCQFSCITDADCPGGFRCVDPLGGDNVYCVNPTCSF